jgi:chromosome partitioning protein
MFTLALISQKGNVGKTTVAMSLAVVAATTGLAVVIIDVDSQATATKWEERQKRDNPIVVAIPVSLLDRELAKARAAGADWVIIDCPGMNESSAVKAAARADLVLIPTSADSIVMETLPVVRDMIRMAKDPPAFIVYNFIHPQGSKIAEGGSGLKPSKILKCSEISSLSE